MSSAHPRGRWLISGAGGQLGRSILALAGEAGVEALGLGRAELDIVDTEAVRRRIEDFRPDVLLNCAAFTAVDLCEEQVREAERGNIAGPEVLAAACGREILLAHISTEYVFDGSGSRPIPEDRPPKPINVYGKTKLGGEEAIRASGCRHLIVRTQWLFGPGPNFVRTILRAAAERPELQVVDDQLGRPTWTGALARGLYEAVAAGSEGTLNLACEGVASWYDLAQGVVEEGARRGLVSRVPIRPVSSRAMARPAARPAYGVLGLERARESGVRLPHWREALISYFDAEQEGRDA
ncbi:MAG: dTDP-4-dehydrorhamnose reductase [bacterium]|nr:dTDP-4-dehydrorhamnose reductase [bacterium]